MPGTDVAPATTICQDKGHGIIFVLKLSRCVPQHNPEASVDYTARMHGKFPLASSVANLYIKDRCRLPTTQPIPIFTHTLEHNYLLQPLLVFIMHLFKNILVFIVISSPAWAAAVTCDDKQPPSLQAQGNPDYTTNQECDTDWDCPFLCSCTVSISIQFYARIL